MSFPVIDASTKSLTNLFSLQNINSPLHDAVISDDISYLRQLLMNRSYDIDIVDEFGRSPLMYSIFVNSYGSFDILMHFGSNLNMLDIDGKSPLHWACQLGHLRIAKALLDCNCDVNQKDGDGRLPLHHVTLHHTTKLLNLVLKKMKQSYIDQQDSFGMSPLHWGAYHNNYEACRSLIRHHSNPVNVDNEGRSPIHLCAGNKNTSTINVLLEFAGQTVLTLQDSQGCTLLHHVVAIQNVTLLSTILNNQHSSLMMNFNLNSKDLQHRTPLHWAFALGSSAIAGILLSHGCDWRILDGNGYLPLHYAIERNFIDCIDSFFSFDHTQDLPDTNDRTSLMLSCQLGHLESTRAILERRINTVNFSSKDSMMSALHYASLGGNIECVKLLLQYGTNIDMQDRHMRTAISYACEHGFFTIVEYLFNSGGSLNIPSIDGRLPLHYAVLNNENSILSLLVTNSDQLDKQDQMGRIPLHYACSLDNVFTISMLGFHQINKQDASGFTPLHWAVMHENINSIKLLVDNGAKLNVMDYSLQRRTPLDLSFFVEDGIIYSFLQKVGCVSGIEIQTLAVIEIQRYWRRILEQRALKDDKIPISNLGCPFPESQERINNKGDFQTYTTPSEIVTSVKKLNRSLTSQKYSTSTSLQISDKQRLLLFNKKTEAVLILQLHWRRYSRRKQLNMIKYIETFKTRTDKNWNYLQRRRELAALLIQLAWRQYLRRKLLISKVVKRKKLFNWSPGCLAIRQRLLIEQLYSQQFQTFQYTPTVSTPVHRPLFVKYIPSPAALSFNFAFDQYCNLSSIDQYSI